MVREILSEEVVLNRIKLGEKPYEAGSSVSDPKNSLYKGPVAGPWFSMFNDQQRGQNGWSPHNERKINRT